jgi:DNA-binding SARP family transcriptional activator
LEDNGVRFGILGPLEARRGGELIDLGAPKQRSVLAMLLVSANAVVSLDRLVDALWGEDPVPTATGALQVYISHLRRALAADGAPRSRSDVIVTQAPGYLLRVGAGDLDATRFETLAAEGHRLLAAGEPGPARAALDEALGLWRGPALAEYAFETFAEREAARLEELRAVALEGRLEADIAMGAHAVAVPELEALVAEWPLREQLWTLLMVALYRCGRQADALRAYSRVRTILGEELGITPGAQLQRLENEILAQSPDLDWRPPPAVASPSTAVPLPQDRDPFVGRERAVEAMNGALVAMLAGQSRIVLVSGEAGIGKTRLVEELAARAEREQAIVVWGATYEGEGAPAFLPWVQVFDDLAAADPAGLTTAMAADGSTLTQVFPSLKELLDDIEPPPALDAAEARFQLFEAVSRVLARFAARRPLVVVLDDLHWADVASLQLAQFVASRATSARLLLVATYRHVDPTPGPALTEALGAFSRHPGVVRLALEGLSAPEVEAFMAQTSGPDTSHELAAAVWARTEGNPFFVRELARLLTAEGRLADAPTDALAVPPGVLDVIRRRLVRLPQPTNELLTLGAVTGRTFDLGVVAEAAGVDPDLAIDLVDSAVASGVLLEDATSFGRYRFSHALVQEAIYGELPAVRRARLHTRVGKAIERVASGPSARVELAHHFAQAAPAIGPEKAVEYALGAAEDALASLAYEAAEEYLRHALALLTSAPSTPDSERLELRVQEQLANLMAMTRGIAAPETGEAWARVSELCGTQDDRRRHVRSLWGVFSFAWAQGRFDDSDKLAQQFVALGTTWSDPAVSAVAMLGLGGSAVFQGRFADARDHLAAGRALVSDDDAAVVDLLFTDLVMNLDAILGLATAILGAPDESSRYLADARQRGYDLGQPFTLAVALVFDAFTLAIRGCPTEALARAEELLAFADEHQMADFSLAEVVRDWAMAIDAGDGAAALFAERDLTQPRPSPFRLWQPFLLGLMAETAKLAGRPGDALLVLDMADAEAQAASARFYDAELLRLRAEVLAETEPHRAAEAVDLLAQARAVADRQGAVLFSRRADDTLRRLT